MHMISVRRLLRWGVRFLAVVMLLFGVFLAALVLLEKRWGAMVVEHSIASLNDQLQVPISTSGVEFTFFENFPRASLHLRNVIVSSSHPEIFGRNDTLLMARSLFLILNPFDLLRGEYKIESLKLSQGYLSLKHGAGGAKNYDILKSTSEDASEHEAQLIIDHFRLEQINFDFHDPAAQLRVNVLIASLTAKGSLGGEMSQLSVNGEGLVHQIKQGDFLFSYKQSFALRSKVNYANSTIYTDNTELQLDRNRLRVQGEINLQEYATKVQLSGSNIDLRTLLAFASQYQFTLPRSMDFKGMLSANITIEGGMRKEDKLLISMGLAGENITMRYDGESYNLAVIQGRFSNGQQATQTSSFFEITKCAIKRKSSELQLQFNLANLHRPTLYSKFQFQLKNNEIQHPKIIKYMPQYESIRGQGEFLTTIENLDSVTFQSLVNPRILLDADFSNITITPNPHQTFSELRGAVTLTGNDLTKGAVQGKWNSATFDIGLHARNFLSLLTRKGRSEWTINTTLTGWEIPPNFIPAWNPSYADSADSTLDQRQLWEDVQHIQGNITLNGCSYRGGSVDSMQAQFAANSGEITIGIERGAILGGDIRGRVHWKTPDEIRQTFHADLYPQNIDLKELFHRFDNFNQTAVTSENITGRLSGAISLYAPLTEWKFDRETLQMRTNITVQRGSLTNVKSLERLASFISLEELRDIQFSTLSNEISIYNQLVTIPSMRINSSALNLTLEGQHHFNSRYQYHVGLRLTDLLFNKIRSRKRDIDDNAVPEESDRFAASLFLIIEGDSSASSIRFDRTALQNRLQEIVRQEKETLQDLLNEEFNWNLGDSMRAPRSRTDKPSYTIEWADDTVKSPTPKPKRQPPAKKKKNVKPPPTVIWEDD